MAGPKRVSGSIFIVPFLAIILMMWLFALHMYPDIYEKYGYDITLEVWRIIGLLILIILIAMVFMASMSTGSPGVVVSSEKKPMMAISDVKKPLEVVPDQEEEADEKAEFVADDEKGEEEKPVKPADKGPKMVDYPPKITGGVYGDTIIPLGRIAKVNIRTIIVRSCSICNHKKDCWGAVKDVLSEDDFKFNVDCIPGLEKVIKAKEKEVPKLDSEFFAEYIKWT